jgi:hypothetical protein
MKNSTLIPLKQPYLVACALLLCAASAVASPPLALVDELSAPAQGDRYGGAIAMQDDLAVVANLSQNAHAAFVYRRQLGGWALQQTLQLDLPATSGELVTGRVHAVSLDQDTLVVGAPFVNVGGNTQRGAVYVYLRNGNSYSLQQRLLGPDLQDQAYFGYATSVQGDTLVVGAPGRKRPNSNSNSSNSGAAFVYTRSAGVWTLRTTLLSPGYIMQNSFYANDVAIDGGRIAVGEAGNDRVHLYTGSGSSWPLSLSLAPASGGEFYGTSLALQGPRLLVGASGADVGPISAAGAVYHYYYSNGWGQLQRISDPNASANDQFGADLAIHDGRLVVGVPSGYINNSGKALLFEANGLYFNYAQDLVGVGTSASFQLGSATAISAVSVLVGDHARTATNANGDVGLVYVFEQPSPKLSLDSATLNWGSVPVGGVEFRTLSLSNAGNANLQINALSLALAPFSRQGGSCGNLLPIVITPGGSCTINYRFAPGAAQAYQQNITVQSNDSLGSQQFNLSGSGLGAQLSVSPSPLNFGTLVIGDNATAMLSISNSGGGTLQINAIEAAQPPFALISNGCGNPPFNLGAGASCTLSYQFSPNVAGDALQSLQIDSSATSSPDSLSLFGFADGPNLNLSPQPLDFGGVAVGAHLDLPLNLQNSGVSPLTISAIDPPQSPFSLISSDCGPPPIQLPADVGCQMIYRYAPTVDGSSAQLLSFASDSPVPLRVLSLLGNGLQPALLMAPAALNYGGVRLGQSLTLGTSLSNPGSAAPDDWRGGCPQRAVQPDRRQLPAGRFCSAARYRMHTQLPLCTDRRRCARAILEHHQQCPGRGAGAAAERSGGGADAHSGPEQYRFRYPGHRHNQRAGCRDAGCRRWSGNQCQCHRRAGCAV